MNKATWLFAGVISLLCAGFASSGDVQDGDHGHLVLAAPEGAEVGYGSWDPAVGGGQAPSWAYLITLRQKSPDEARVERTSWEQNAAFADTIQFFNSGSPTRRIDVQRKPSSVPGWSGPDESVALNIGVGGQHISYRRTVFGPLANGERKPAVVDNKVFDRNGAVVSGGANAGAASISGRFARGPRSIIDLKSGEERSIRAGSVLFSRYDDSHVVYQPGKGEIEYRDAQGQARWSLEVAEGPLRLAVISPGGQYVFAVAGEDGMGVVAAMADASGHLLWKTPVSVGSWSAGFSRDGRHVALVTADTNWIFEAATGKVLAKVPMTGVFGGEKLSPHSSRVYVEGDSPRAVVIAGTLRLDSRDEARKLPPSGNDVVYEYSEAGGRVTERFPRQTFILAGAGISREPAVSLSPDGAWLYYLTGKGLFARRLK